MYQKTCYRMTKKGFTLIELMVAVGIIAVLASIVSIATADYLKQGRDAQRQSDLQNIKSAIELYRTQNGRYPEMGCTPVGGWSRQQDCSNFITGLTAVLPQIPRDPRFGEGDGYVYRTNTSGTVYKLMVRGSMEQAVTATHPLQSCDPTFCSAGCSGSALYTSSIAVWGGFADDVRGTESDTAAVICAM